MPPLSSLPHASHLSLAPPPSPPPSVVASLRRRRPIDRRRQACNMAYSAAFPSSLLLLVAATVTAVFLSSSVLSSTLAFAIRIDVIRLPWGPGPAPPALAFREAPAFRNGDECSPSHQVDIAMTLDANYLRGTMAAVLSILQHTSCPENVAFYFLAGRFEPEILSAINATFPYLNFKLYRFDSNRVRHRISRSIRHALDQPLNYARIYLADILPLDVARIIYLDSDVVVVDDIQRLWEVDLGDDHVVAAPEYCHANFSNYFTNSFWSDATLSSTFSGRSPCYFNTGVMVVEVEKWRRGNYTRVMEEWMGVQKQKRIYNLGSLPPYLLVFAGKIKPVDHRWNRHGLGGDNVEGKCRSLPPGPISLLHWSGKGKPWLRLDSRKPCPVDHLWAPYDLYRTASPSQQLEG